MAEKCSMGDMKSGGGMKMGGMKSAAPPRAKPRGKKREPKR